MVKNTLINYDLEYSPLKIKTDSLIGSRDILKVYFYTSNGQFAGGIIIRLNTNPEYYLHRCRESYESFPANPPADDNRIWKITKILDPLGITVHNNDVKILDFRFSDTTCTRWYKNRWNSYWGTKMKRMKYSGNSESNFYYHATGKWNMLICVMLR